MTIQVYVTSVDPDTASSLNLDETEILPTLGQDKPIAVQLEELFTSVTHAITASLEVESQLTLEITGSLSLKAEAGVRYLFFNVGAETDVTGKMKVILSTTVKPKGIMVE